jgi:hypothetical protein
MNNITDNILSEKEYENIIIKNDKFTEDTLIALGLVKKYIISNNLIVVGGMAIDTSLKLKGTQLYADDILPDYDFYSPNHHIDAYKIAEILHKTGMENITVINANHTSTMRVRVNYTVVADVTYIPPIIYKNLPVLIYKDLRVIHPHFQMIDQHRSLSLPYENPPWEVIVHRWKKDASRYDLLYKYYPIKKPKELLDAPAKDKFKLTDSILITSLLFRNQCIGGFAGLLYWIDLAKSHGFKQTTPIEIGNIQIESAGIIVKIPLDSHGVSVYSNDIEKLYTTLKKSKNIKKERMYRRFLDKLQFKIILDDTWELFDNAGYMISAYKLDIDIYITNLQNIMLYMLTNYILLSKIKQIKRGYSFYVGYLIARELVEWAGKLYTKPSSKSKKTIYKLFLPSHEVFGDSEISDSYLNSKRIFLETVEGKHKLSNTFQPSIVFPETFINGKIPKKYYNFNASKSYLFKFDGNIAKSYIKRF